MKAAVINMIFEGYLSEFTNALTNKNQTKEEFLESVIKTYPQENYKTPIFCASIKQCDFETIRLSNDRESVLFNQ